MSKLQEEGIKHYKKMIEWAKTQNSNETPCKSKMYEAIGTFWGARFCPYCTSEIYKRSCEPIEDEGYEGCPLNKCCENEYDYLLRATTWKEWINWAEAVLKFIEEKG